jgi:hypothetical protein
MLYGPDIDAADRHLANYADRVLKRAKAADLPIEQRTKFELLINLISCRPGDKSGHRAVRSRAAAVRLAPHLRGGPS